MDTHTPLPPLVSENSKKRVFQGGSSIDAEVVEISRPINWSSKSKSSKQKEVICHEIIDVDMEEDCSDVKGSDGNVKFSGKGKETLVGDGSLANSGPVDGVQSSKKNCLSESNNPIIIDDFDDVPYGLDEDMAMYHEDFGYDHYAALQSHFDNMDIPAGVEAQIPWMPGPTKEQVVSTSYGLGNQSIPGAPFVPKFPAGSPVSAGWTNVLLPPTTPISAGVIHASGAMNYFPQSLHNSATTAGNPSISSGPAFNGEQVVSTSYGWGNQSIPSAPFVPKLPTGSPVSAGWTNILLPPTTPISAGVTHASGAMNYFPQSLHNSATTAGNPAISSGPACNGEQNRNLGEFLKKFRLFKKFDTVEDHSDHFYSQQASSGNVASKNWAKKIQDEWKILEKDLPDTIFVRVYETRMDLLRAVIMGADGTPYHDGLFFFDVFFPSNYPNVPPLVHYHSFGLRINPNLYNCGKVCLSLLNTWTGQGKEKWIPRVSTMLQVLVSIQGLILNANPYFNEPGYASSNGTTRGDKSSQQYNENTYILNLKTMVYSMRRPPKHFEDFVLGHYFQSAQDILVACKAYTDGAQVGSLVRGGVQDVDEGDKSCSPTFKASLSGFIKTIIDTFKEIGARDCDKFLYLAQRGTAVVPPVVPVYAMNHLYG